MKEIDLALENLSLKFVHNVYKRMIDKKLKVIRIVNQIMSPPSDLIHDKIYTLEEVSAILKYPNYEEIIYNNQPVLAQYLLDNQVTHSDKNYHYGYIIDASGFKNKFKIKIK